jgi:hypothetical protein
MVGAMNRYHVDIVTALYRHRGGPGSPTIYQWDHDGKFALPISDWDRKVGAVRIGSAGAGCLLVKRTVFDRIEKELKAKPFDVLPTYGEDHSFFKRCWELKIPAYALTHVESPHLVVQGLTMADYHPVTTAKKDQIETDGLR